MPFQNFVAHAFTPPTIRALAPQSPGVFGISSAREWIYIGESDNIQQALLLLFAGDSSQFMARRPTGFVFEICHAAARAARQDRLIMEYEPVCNRPWHQAHSSQDGAL